MARTVSGGLAGWRWSESANGCVLELQIGEAATDFSEKQFTKAIVALNDRQLRSLARDLQRAAKNRNIDLWARPKLWERLIGWTKNTLSRRASY